MPTRRKDCAHRRIIGSKIIRFRQERHLTRHGLADKAGITYQTLWTIETGKVNFSLDMLYKIANALDCSPKDLLHERG